MRFARRKAGRVPSSTLKGLVMRIITALTFACLAILSPGRADARATGRAAPISPTYVKPDATPCTSEGRIATAATRCEIGIGRKAKTHDLRIPKTTTGRPASQ